MPAFVQPVLDLVPEAGAREALLDERVLDPDTLVRESLSPASTLSPIDIAGNGFGFWNTMPIRVRTCVALSAPP